MKNFFTIIILFLSAFNQFSAQKEKLNELFDQYQEADGITSIKIAKPMFGMLSKLDIDDNSMNQIRPLLNKINGLKILIIEKPDSLENVKNAKVGQQFNLLKSQINNAVKNLHYEELMSVNNKDNKIKFLSADTQNGILDQLLLNIDSDGEQVLMILDGKISMDDVNKLLSEAANEKPTAKVVTENISSSGMVQIRQVEKFSGIEVSQGIKVNYTQGNPQTVRVETDRDKIQYISTEVENDILKISVKNKGNKNLNFNKIFVDVVSPELSYIKTTSGSKFSTLNSVKSKEFRIVSESGSNIDGDFEAGFVSLEFNSGSSSKINLLAEKVNVRADSGSGSNISGRADLVNLQVNSAANCNAQDLITKNVLVEASSGATTTLNVLEDLSAKASSGATIRYKGNPKNIYKDISGISGGKLKKID